MESEKTPMSLRWVLHFIIIIILQSESDFISCSLSSGLDASFFSTQSNKLNINNEIGTVPGGEWPKDERCVTDHRLKLKHALSNHQSSAYGRQWLVVTRSIRALRFDEWVALSCVWTYVLHCTQFGHRPDGGREAYSPLGVRQSIASVQLALPGRHQETDQFSHQARVNWVTVWMLRFN